MAVSRIVRPIVPLARKPDPKMLPALLISSCLATGPLTSRNGAVPVVLPGDRPHLLLGELSRERAQSLLLFRQGERDPACDLALDEGGHAAPWG
jgi:hypothetical protein